MFRLSILAGLVVQDSLVSQFVADAAMSLEDDKAAVHEEVSRLHDDLIASRREAAAARREQAASESQATEVGPRCRRARMDYRWCFGVTSWIDSHQLVANCRQSFFALRLWTRC